MQSTQIQASQLHSSDVLHHQFNDQFRLLNTILNTQSESQNTLHLLQQQHQSLSSPSKISSTGPSAAMNVKMTYISEPKDPCSVRSQPCGCRCHTTHQVRSPSLLDRFMGALFVGYSGSPATLNKCSIRSCKARSFFKADIYYVFPPWLIRDVFISILVRSFPCKITTSFTVRNIVANASPIFHYAISNDGCGLQRLFDSRLARPNDIQGYGGKDALNVRCLLCRSQS